MTWVNDSKLVISKGMTGATGNFYAGLHEYWEMAFTLHYLRRGDLFLDVGANVGTYTVLAAAVRGASTISLEPVPTTYHHLLVNVRINGCEHLVRAVNAAAGAEVGSLAFTADLDTANHVLSEGEAAGRTIAVPVVKLDDLVAERTPTLMKIDVEGFEALVLRGAPETLSRVSVVQIELGVGEGRYGSTDRDVAEVLTKAGLTPHIYDPKARELKPTSALAGNVLYIRNPMEAQERVRDATTFSVHGSQV